MMQVIERLSDGNSSYIALVLVVGFGMIVGSYKLTDDKLQEVKSIALANQKTMQQMQQDLAVIKYQLNIKPNRVTAVVHTSGHP